MRLHLIRHPRPEVAANICYGRLDIGLHEPAPLAAQRIKPLLPANLPLWSSPARRCRELATALHTEPQWDDRLLEIDFGDWEGKDWNDVDRNSLDAWAKHPASFIIPGGESGFQVQARALEFVQELVQNGIEEATLVTHAGIMRTLVAHAQQLPEQQWPTLRFEYEALHTLDLKAPPL